MEKPGKAMTGRPDAPKERIAAHTPGPWVAVLNERSIEVATVAIIGDYVVGVPTPGVPGGNYRDTDFGSDEADGRLIAAAPDLLAALERVLPELRGLAYMSNKAKELVMLSESAIAKARGQA